MTTTPKTLGSSHLSLLQWLSGRSLSEVMHETEQNIKNAPGDPSQRWLLFQLLCIQGDWSRGLKQLQLYAQMQGDFAQQAQLYRGLIGCELFRYECFVGKRLPTFILPQPAWVAQMLAAITFNQQGDEARADSLREASLDAAGESSGVDASGTAFTWISDSDSWLGPIVELVVGGMYAWVPFSQIKHISSEPPKNMLDLLWKPARLELMDGSEHRVFLMARYCGSESGKDVLRLCRETAWHDHGRTSVRALGQKTWQTDRGEIGLLDITSCTFNLPDGPEVKHG